MGWMDRFKKTPPAIDPKVLDSAIATRIDALKLAVIQDVREQMSHVRSTMRRVTEENKQLRDLVVKSMGKQQELSQQLDSLRQSVESGATQLQRHMRDYNRQRGIAAPGTLPSEILALGMGDASAQNREHKDGTPVIERRRHRMG